MDQKDLLRKAKEESKRTRVRVSDILRIWGEASSKAEPIEERKLQIMTRRIARVTARNGLAIGKALQSVLPKLQQK